VGESIRTLDSLLGRQSFFILIALVSLTTYSKAYTIGGAYASLLS